MPSSATETGVRRIWTEALGAEPEADDTDFFDAGGQSLGLIRFLAAVQDTYGVELPIHELFAEGFTVATAAAAIDRTIAAGPANDGFDADHDALLDELEQLSDDELRALLADGA